MASVVSRSRACVCPAGPSLAVPMPQLSDYKMDKYSFRPALEKTCSQPLHTLESQSYKVVRCKNYHLVQATPLNFNLLSRNLMMFTLTSLIRTNIHLRLHSIGPSLPSVLSRSLHFILFYSFLPSWVKLCIKARNIPFDSLFLLQGKQIH